MTFTRRHTALALTAAASALPLRAWAQAPVTEEPAEVGPDTTVETAESAYKHLMAPVTINGQGPFDFLIDTGANFSCVSERLAARLRLTPLAPARVHTVAGVRERRIYLADDLRVGERHRRRVRVAALAFPDVEIDGVLGVDWLKGQRLVLDFKSDAMLITRSRPDETQDKRVVVPARRRLGQLTIVDADLSGERINAIIDSGAQTSMCNGPLRELVRQRERRSRLPTDQPRFVQMQSIAGEGFLGESLYLPFLRLGGLHLGNVPIIHADTHVFNIWKLTDQPALVLGMDLLTQFDLVALDFGRSAVRFDFV